MKRISTALTLSVVMSMVSGPAILGAAEKVSVAHSMPGIFIGVASNPDLPGPAGELILNVYLAVNKDGTGVGTVSDTLHPEANAHLAVQQFARQGNAVHFAGVIQAAHDPALVGRPFVVDGVVAGSFTTLELLLEGAKYVGEGIDATIPFACLDLTGKSFDNCLKAHHIVL